MNFTRVGKKKLLSAFLAAICPSLISFASEPSHAKPEELPSRREVLALLHKVNDWQRAHPALPPQDRNWERATWYTGVVSAWKETGDRKFFNQAMDWGRQHDWQVATEEDGPNRLFCVETWLELYFVKKDPRMIEPAIQWLKTPKPNSPAGAQRWYLESWGKNRTYVDSLYGASALAMMAKATQDKRYLDIMQAFFNDVTAELFDKESGLYYRDVRFIGQKTANGKKILWSRGNGWAFAGIARILEYLPEDDSSRPEYVRLFRSIASELVKRQGKNGLWNPNLDDPEDVPTPESSGTGFFCFGLAWGIRHHILESSLYLPSVLKAWGGLCQNVSPDGKVRGGQQVDDRPHALKEEIALEYVAGTFLLAGSQIYKLTPAK
jgi:unsaturated rhamnogalacturonyl hydrolase